MVMGPTLPAGGRPGGGAWAPRTEGGAQRTPLAPGITHRHAAGGAQRNPRGGPPYATASCETRGGGRRGVRGGGGGGGGGGIADGECAISRGDMAPVVRRCGGPGPGWGAKKRGVGAPRGLLIVAGMCVRDVRRVGPATCVGRRRPRAGCARGGYCAPRNGRAGVGTRIWWGPPAKHARYARVGVPAGDRRQRAPGARLARPIRGERLAGLGPRQNPAHGAPARRTTSPAIGWRRTLSGSQACWCGRRASNGQTQRSGRGGREPAPPPGAPGGGGVCCRGGGGARRVGVGRHRARTPRKGQGRRGGATCGGGRLPSDPPARVRERASERPRLVRVRPRPVPGGGGGGPRRYTRRVTAPGGWGGGGGGGGGVGGGGRGGGGGASRTTRSLGGGPKLTGAALLEREAGCPPGPRRGRRAGRRPAIFRMFGGLVFCLFLFMGGDSSEGPHASGGGASGAAPT